MKKVVLSLAFVAAVLVSCNKKAEETPAADSTAVDTTAVVADTAAVKTDSAATKTEEVKK